MVERSVFEFAKDRAWLYQLENRVRPKLSRVAFGPSPPNVFVGEYGYPSVRAGPLVALEKSVLDAPMDLYGLNYPALLHHRAHLARGFNVRPVNRVLENSFWIAASQKAVDVEATFESAPRFSLTVSDQVQPLGPSAPLEKLALAENPSVPKKVDTLIGEKLKVAEALPELFPRFDYHYVQKLLSAGILGQERKLVPTKWSITATDDLLSKQMLEEIRDFPAVKECRIYSNTYLFNHFEILLLPGSWEFEQFESFETGESLEHEYEGFFGRTTYAKTEGGGYYAGRFGVTEALHQLGRQARCVVFREVSPQYTIPGGVWVVRETVRNAFTKAPTKCNTLEEAWSILKPRLKKPPASYCAKSSILTQRTLSQY